MLRVWRTAAGPAGLGVHRAAAERSAGRGVDLWGVGVDVDEWAQVDADVKGHVLTSVRERHDLAVRAAVRAHLDGALADLTMSVDNGGFSLSESGGHLDPATLDVVGRAADALAARQVQIGTSIRDLSLGAVPSSAATAAAGGRHEVAFGPPVAGAWGVTCGQSAGDGSGEVVGLITAEAVTSPVRATATATFAGRACSWDGPESMAVDDVVRVAIRNDSEVTMHFGAGMVVPGTGLDDLRNRAFEVITRIRTVPPDLRAALTDQPSLQVAPGTTSEVLLQRRRRTTSARDVDNDEPGRQPWPRRAR